MTLAERDERARRINAFIYGMATGVLLMGIASAPIVYVLWRLARTVGG